MYDNQTKPQASTPDLEEQMATVSRRDKPAGLPGGVRIGALDGRAAGGRRSQLLERLTQGTPHDDLRDWLEMVDAAGELRVLDGVDAEENIGRITEMLHHTDGAPAVLFDKVPGYPDGFRLLVNA